MYDELGNLSGITVYPSDANFFLIKVPDADEYFNKLVKMGVLVRNFNGSPGLDNCLRVTIGTPSENSEFLKAISAISSS